MLGVPSGSVQLAVIVTASGALPLAGVACGEHCSGGETATVWLADPLSPKESIAVSTTLKVPLELYLCETVKPGFTKVGVVPSPHCRYTWVMLSSGAVHSPDAVTLKGATPEVGVTFSVHVGCASAASAHNRQSSARVMNMPRRMVSSPRRDRRGVFTTSTSQKWLERARSFAQQL